MYPTKRMMYGFILTLLITLLFMATACTQKKDPITYCGEKEEDGPWADCDPERYDVDGPVERLLNKGISQIIMIDLTVGGVRFGKTFNVVQMTKKAMSAWEESQVTSAVPVEAVANKIGVIFVVHGGFETYELQYLWDASMQMFTYDPNHPVSLFFLWNKNMWGQILHTGNAEKEVPKYAFNYERIGGIDPFQSITDNLVLHLQDELDKLGSENGLEFEVDWAGWMSGDDPSHYAYPRYMYDPEDKDDCPLALAPNIPLIWVNDYTNLMERSYPIEPEDWTRSLGLPEIDQQVPLDGSPNPVAEDPELAALHVEAIEVAMSDKVPDSETGVLILNHALHDNNEVFDPKINDTLSIINNIESQLLDRHPTMASDNIIGAYMGIKEVNPENGLEERTREMRGENLGHAWLYESDKELPAGKWGYRYWEALEYLKNRGVKHIVVSFTQIVADSVLNLVEVHNQIGKEIGAKTWLYYEEGDYDFYPDVGHPFADYWGIWVETDCDGEECCFVMGGCDDGRPYPPARQTPMNQKRGDMDPSLAYDISDYGHLGYDPDLGPPDPNGPVQDQYTGTWALYRPPNDDHRLSKLMAKHVINTVLGNLE